MSCQLVSLYQWARRNMTEDFNFQQHRCENLKPRTTLSHLKLNLRISKPIMKNYVFQFLALEFKNGPLNEGLILEVKDQLLSLLVVVLSYSVALSNALCSLVKTPLVFEGEDVLYVAQGGFI